jgi:WD40-like Beta Propeller Repeat
VPGFAVDAGDDLFTRNELGAVAEFSSSGVVLDAAFDTEPVSGLASEVDAGEAGRGFVYAVAGGSLTRLGSGGIAAGVVERLMLGGGDGAGVAVNAAGEELYVSEASAGDVERFVAEQPKAPTVEAESVSTVTGDSAVLEGEVNPRGAVSEYHFEYGACASAGTCAGSGYEASVPDPAGSAGSGYGLHVLAAASVSGLAAGTTYHFRVVAGNVHGVTDGVERTFTTQAAGPLVLPDGRVWELVSPADKHGALIETLGEEVDIQAAVGGGAFTYAADAPTEPSPQGYEAAVQVLSTRGADGGWSSRDMTIPHEAAAREPVGLGKEYRVFSEDLSEAVVQPFGSFVACGSPQPCLSGEASEQTAFLASSYVPGGGGAPCRVGLAGCFKPLVTARTGFANVPEGTVFGEEGKCEGSEPEQVYCGPEYVGASPNAEHVIVSGVGGSGAGLYEWNQGKPAGEQLAFISELPESEGGGPASGADIGFLHNRDVRHAVSADGTRVFWTSNDTESGGPLYVRDTAKRETLRVDAGEGKFQFASSDGSRVFYTENGVLQECLIEEEAGKLKCASREVGAGVVGTVIGGSEDGSWVYFVSNSVLAAGGVPGVCATGPVQPAGAVCDLYVSHGGVTRLVAVLEGADVNDWAGSAPADLGTLTGRVSPDGEWLAFMSGRELTGYDNRDAVTGAPDQEVYLYDAAGAGSLVCASCDPSGARPVGEEAQKTATIERGIVGGVAWTGSPTMLAATVPAWSAYRLYASVYQSRYLSDSGRLFFDGFDPLVAQAVNGDWDVYEYEPGGVGGCSAGSGTFSARSGGCVGLISGGSSPRESAFLDASESGGDVFFMTVAKLSGADTDESLDVYDAHECSAVAPCGGVSVTAPGACDGEASCRGVVAAAPEVFGAPGSETFSGPGDVVATPVPVVAPVKTAAQVRAEKLAKALKVCRVKRKRAKRVACEARARRAYGPAKKVAVKKAKKAAKTAGSVGSGRGAGR